ncbi:hypothetical protein ACWEWU_14715 [Staphylococcus xylosus]
MNLGLTILIWLLVIAILLVFLIYGFAFIASIVLAIKGKRDFERLQAKHQEEFEEFQKHCEERMKKFREEHSHITKELDNHSKE